MSDKSQEQPLSWAAKAEGMMLGLAIGDALGYQVEFIKLAEIREKYGPQGVTELGEGKISDDTQMTVEVARALVDGDSNDLEPFMDRVVANFIQWKKDQEIPENRRAPGKTCLGGVSQLEQGISWRESGVKDRPGCGSAMRIAPVGFLFSAQPERIVEMAHPVGICTHAHPTADAACVAAALLAGMATEGVDPGEYIGRLQQLIGGRDQAMDDKLAQVEQLLAGEIDDDRALREIGEGWYGHEAVAASLYCFLRSPQNFREIVVRGSNVDGDSDSIASIAGGLCGAYMGGEVIPQEWQEKVERTAELRELAGKLAARKKA